MNRLNSLIEAAKAATPGPWAKKRMGEWDRGYYYGVHMSPVRSISVDLGEHNATFIALANPATILELCALLEKAGDALDHMVRAAAEQHCGLKIADEALAAIKQWKEQT